MSSYMLESLPIKPHEVAEENAQKFAEWISARGGVLVWESHDFGDPGKSVSTPARDKAGNLAASPHWKYTDKPAWLVNRLDLVTVFTVKVVETIQIRLKQSQGRLVLNNTSDRKLKGILDRLRGQGHDPFYRFVSTGSADGNPVYGMLFGCDSVGVCIDGERMPLPRWLELHPQPQPATV